MLKYSHPDIGEEEIRAVVDVLRSGWVTTGPITERFEQDFYEYLGHNDLFCLAVNSATSGLHLALEALGVKPGDEVIVPTMTFTATAEVVRYLGADPVLVDVDPLTLNIDVSKIRDAVSKRTKVIIPVHYGGLSCQMDEIISIANELNLRVVEDAAHALTATWDGTKIGGLKSDITVFSFYANKVMTTGEGGMIVSRKHDLIERMKVMRLHGINRDVFNRFISETPSWKYEVVAPGFKYNLTDIAASLGIVQLKRLPYFLNRRIKLALNYLDKLSELPVILPATPPIGDIHAWHLFVLRLTDTALSNGYSRDVVIEGLFNQGIGTSVHYLPLHRHPYWREKYHLTSQMFPVADNAYQTMLSIPLYTTMTDKDQQLVINALHEIFK